MKIDPKDPQFKAVALVGALCLGIFAGHSSFTRQPPPATEPLSKTMEDLNTPTPIRIMEMADCVARSQGGVSYPTYLPSPLDSREVASTKMAILIASIKFTNTFLEIMERMEKMGASAEDVEEFIKRLDFIASDSTSTNDEIAIEILSCFED